MRQSSEEEEEQCQPTPSHDHAASRLVKIELVVRPGGMVEVDKEVIVVDVHG